MRTSPWQRLSTRYHVVPSPNRCTLQTYANGQTLVVIFWIENYIMATTDNFDNYVHSIEHFFH